MHLFAFLIYFLLIRTIWLSCLKECSLQFWSLPVITSILQPAARGAGRGILSSCSTNPSLLAHQAPAAHQHCPCSLCRGKNPGCKVTDPPILWECSHMCKILHVPGSLCHPSWLLERQLSCSVWNAFSSPLHSLCWFSRQNQNYWMLGEVQHEHNVLTAHPGSSQDPATSQPFLHSPRSVPEQGGAAALGGSKGSWGGDPVICELCGLCSEALRAGQGTVWVGFVMEYQGRQTSSSFPGALSCPLRLLASVVFPSRKLLWITTPWSCRKNQRVLIPGLWQTRSPFLWS